MHEKGSTWDTSLNLPSGKGSADDSGKGDGGFGRRSDIKI